MDILVHSSVNVSNNYLYTIGIPVFLCITDIRLDNSHKFWYSNSHRIVGDKSISIEKREWRTEEVGILDINIGTLCAKVMSGKIVISHRRCWTICATSSCYWVGEGSIGASIQTCVVSLKCIRLWGGWAFTNASICWFISK